MAVYTKLDSADGERIAGAHELGQLRGIAPIAAGSVNSNYFLDTERGRWFCRIYEEQESDGVAYEWAVLGHLADHGLPVPVRVAGPAPGDVRVQGKPTAVFELVGGAETCQAGVTVARAASVGAFLARAHRALDDFPERREGRFTTMDVRKRLDSAAAAGDAQLTPVISTVRGALDEVERDLPRDLPRGVIHGDLFRDNVRFDGDRIVAAIDWESASDEARVYDIAVTLLAWCWGDDLDVQLGRALAGAYVAARPLTGAERDALRLSAMAAAARFTTTRITDFHLRGDAGGTRVMKDYRRFLARLERVTAMSSDEFATTLGI
ncbi:MAG: homoserine kinase [Deltaproteobacteria bacterium]|nr:homoserine kinase [Deltaproteobacteria bacterium]